MQHEIVEQHDHSKLIQPDGPIAQKISGAPGGKLPIGPVKTGVLDKSKWKMNNLIQITWDNLKIKTSPPGKRCCGLKAPPPYTEKIIVDGISGTVLPGQFVAILGASGKFLQSNFL